MERDHKKRVPESKPDMATLRAICDIPKQGIDSVGPIELERVLYPCPKTGFNETDGETYRCSLAKGHRACLDVGCPMCERRSKMPTIDLQPKQSEMYRLAEER